MKADPLSPEVPTLEEINKALADFNQAVDKEDVLAGTVYAAVCTGVLERLRDLLTSGQYALVSREDRIKALAAQRRAVRYYDTGQHAESDAATNLAEKHLQMGEPS